MNIPQKIINKIVLFFANHYIFEEINTLKGKQQQVASKLHYYTKLHPFAGDDIKMLRELDPYFKVMLDVELSYQVFGFEVLALWSRDIPKPQRPFLNIKDINLQRGSTYYMKESLALKYKDEAKHKEKKEIMTTSTDKAKEFYTFLCEYEMSEKV